ncbi:MAG: hypothetical protein Ta2E_08980 [Mycoplasmoidaceae bacterium]|nr:MAG: hypothetical protein Ta2E_08980 [Mycoplasmoidaceae bacterium]
MNEKSFSAQFVINQPEIIQTRSCDNLTVDNHRVPLKNVDNLKDHNGIKMLGDMMRLAWDIFWKLFHKSKDWVFKKDILS